MSNKLFLPNYFACRKAIKRLKKFQSLVWHDWNYAGEKRFAIPIEKLLPKGIKESDYRKIIATEINRLIPLIYSDLNKAYIETNIVDEGYSEEFNYEKMRPETKKTKHHYNILRDYFELPEEGGMYKSIIHCLDRGIGTYEDRLSKAKWEVFNPGIWIVSIVRFPIWILERAGLIETGEMKSIWVKPLCLVYTKHVSTYFTILGN